MKRADAITLILFAVVLIFMSAATIINAKAPRSVEIGDLYLMNETAAPWCLDIWQGNIRHVLAFGSPEDADNYVRGLMADKRYKVKARGWK